VTRAIDSVRLCIEHLRSDAGHVVPMGEPTRRPTGLRLRRRNRSAWWWR
jgi:hypothetical protein